MLYYTIANIIYYNLVHIIACLAFRVWQPPAALGLESTMRRFVGKDLGVCQQPSGAWPLDCKEQPVLIGYILGFYRGNGKENGNYHGIQGYIDISWLQISVHVATTRQETMAKVPGRHWTAFCNASGLAIA